MAEIYWMLAQTMHDLQEAQRVRWTCLREELGVRARDATSLRCDASLLDVLPNVHHVLVYDGEEPVGTARLMQASTDVAHATGSRHGFELEAEVDLSPLNVAGPELAEISRLCVRKAHAGRAAVRLYEGLYAQSRSLGVRWWVGGVDCCTAHLDDAERLCAVLERHGLISRERQIRTEPTAAGDHARVGSNLADSADAAGDAGELPALPHALGAFVRRLNARAIGGPVRHAQFDRFVIPMIADLDELPASTLALFDGSVTAGFTVPRAAWARLAHAAHESLRRLDQHPIGGALVAGTLPRDQYVAYLTQVIHQTRDAASLLARAAERLDQLGRHRLAEMFRRKSAEEDGHDAWALQDLLALRVSRASALSAPCCSAVQTYGAWLRHCAEATPTAILGLAFTLEWFGSARAGRAAANLVRRSSITGIESAVSFLAGHGAADDGHLRAFAQPFADITDPHEIDSIVLSARLAANLYLAMLDWAGAAGPSIGVALPQL